MIINVFSIFDPSTSFFNLSWLILMIPVITISNLTINIYSNNILTFSSVINNVTTQEGNNENPGNSIFNQISNGLLAYCITINIIAILPFNFTPTAHISVTFFIGISMWLGVIVNAMSNSMSNTIAHLTPIGTPTPLINFIVVIEIISLIIRPITIAVRLIANIVAGHLLLSLLSSFSISTITVFYSTIIPMIVLLSLETAVAIIQAYVITTLVTLYYKESL